MSDGAVSKDCAWLRSVARWATEYRDPVTDELLLERDPTRGLKMPKQMNPSRPVATHDRVDALREVYRKPQMQMGGTLVQSYLPELLELAVGTGRRIGAICALKVEDLKLEGTSGAPWGAIVWPADTDKMGKSWRCPISAPVRGAIRTALKKREQHGRVGLGPLFPGSQGPEHLGRLPPGKYVAPESREAGRPGVTGGWPLASVPTTLGNRAEGSPGPRHCEGGRVVLPSGTPTVLHSRGRRDASPRRNSRDRAAGGPMIDERHEPSKDERDTDTAFHEEEMDADRPPGPEVQAALDRLASELGQERTDG